MMIDPTVDPLHWPLEDMLVMLCDPSAERNEDAQLLIEQLIRIRDPIDVGGM